MKHVVATAGHVDHGKSTLVRALTGMEPDRWAEEKRRGLTIDLGFAWTVLESGREVSFVDVPGHERFLGNMLAGLGPAPVVCFVVAADEGWQAQSSDHRDAVAALGIDRGVIVVTKTDRAPHRLAEVTAQVRAELATTGLRDAPVVAVSASTKAGLHDFRLALDHVLAKSPPPDADARLRLWVDRAFSIKGAGTVITGTLGAGTLRVGQALTLLNNDGAHNITVRGLQSHNQSVESATPTMRVAVNLRGERVEQIGRGDVLLSPGQWPTTSQLDVRRTAGPAFTTVPARVLLHVGTATLPARLRAFDDDHARLRVDRCLPVIPGDRLVLRYPEADVVMGGARVLDVDAHPLQRRGAGAEHTQWLASLNDDGDPLAVIHRCGAVAKKRLAQLGFRYAESGIPTDQDVLPLADWWVSRPTLTQWINQLTAAVRQLQAQDPMTPGLATGAVSELLGIADRDLTAAVMAHSGLRQRDGYLSTPDHIPHLGAAEHSVRSVEERLAASPFNAPEAHELAQVGLGNKELATAQKLGRLLRLGDGVVVLPKTPALAMRELAALDQPFTTSQARQTLGTTRRVVIPLLEHLDAKGWTTRVDSTHRRVN